MKTKDITKYQRETLKVLSGKIDDFYLAGGTALALFYFQHRVSVDLDFFSQNFSPKRVEEIAAFLKMSLKKEITLTQSAGGGELAMISVYNIYFSAKFSLKVDFVEDVIELIKRPANVDGINILSLEDIYIRKLYAVCGVVKTTDKSGRTRFIGGRTEAKDFYDLFMLSNTFMPLSKFVGEYGNANIVEALVGWYSTYDRMGVIDGLLNLDTTKKVDFKAIDQHFKKEIGRIIEAELDDK